MFKTRCKDCGSKDAVWSQRFGAILCNGCENRRLLKVLEKAVDRHIEEIRAFLNGA